MRTLVRIIALGMLVAGFAVAPAFAQCEPEAKQAQYDAFLANRRAKTVDLRKAAVEAGKKFVEMCKDTTDDADKQIIDYINKDIPKIEKWIAGEIRAQRFNEAAKLKNYPEAYAAAKDILANEPPDSKIALDLILYLASSGLELSNKPAAPANYGTETMGFAKDAIAQIESGKVSTEWGLFDMNYKTKDAASSKDNARGWMNFTIALLLSRNKQDKEAADYFYKTSMIPSSIQEDASVYNGIGGYYFAEVFRLQGEIKAKFDLNTEADNIEGKRLLGIARAYAERGVDAFARAQTAFTKAGKKEAADAAGEKVSALYSFRFSGKTEGKDEYVSGLLQKPMPAPNSELVPVPDDPAPAPAPTPTPTTSGTTPAPPKGN